MEAGNKWNAQDVRSAFEGRGYQRIAAPARETLNVWYQAPVVSKEVQQYLMLRHLPNARAYDVMFGYAGIEAQGILNSVISEIREIVGSGRWPPVRPCWTLFSASRAMKWESLSIPNALKRETGPRQFSELFDKFLISKFESATTAHMVVETLLQDEIPFEWRYGNPITRAAELIALAITSQIDVDDLADRIIARRDRLSPLFQVDDNWHRCVGRLCSVLVAASAANNVMK